ncbi:MAG: flagellar basal body P-ring protein FlgI [Gemmatimonadales bacterium]|nr:flagellar basal body P-ring protein FlgI [Gemmatimonadales bacterium]
MRILSSAGLAVALVLAAAPSVRAQTRIGEVTTHEGEVPVRLVGYGLVVGLDGTGDRSLGIQTGATHTVRSVANLLRRFNVEVPPDRLRLRNVAAVVVTAEFSPFLRPGGRFDVQVSSLGDATSLNGGTLWITPLVADPDGAAVATAQGTLVIAGDDRNSGRRAPRAGGGRLPDAGILEVALPLPARPASIKLLLRQPNLGLAVRIAGAIQVAFGDSTAQVDDPGSITLKPKAPAADNVQSFLAAVDTLPVDVLAESRIVIDARSGVIAAGGDVRVGPSVVSLRGITVRIHAGQADTTAAVPGVIALGTGATVQDVAAGLHALGAQPSEIAAVFDALRTAGAIRATVITR